MRLWSSLNRAAQPAERKDAATRRFSAGSNYTVQGVPLYPAMGDLDVDRATSDAWGRVIWAYRAIDARAKNAARLQVMITDGRGPGAKEIENHPLALVLNRQANQYESAFAFRYRLHTQMDLSKKGVFVEVIENRKGDVASLHLLHPKWTSPIPNADTFVSGFEMRLPNGEVFNQLPPYQKGKGGVLWIRRPHPMDPYSSSTWLEAAGMSIDLDHYARVYNRNFLFNDGRPGGVLMVQSEDGIEEADAAVLQARMSGGPNTAGKVTIMEADAMSYVDLATTPRDAQYVEARALSKQEILAAAGTPESLWNASGRTFDNADAELESFWRNEMVPEVELVASFYEQMTDGGALDDSQVVTYDYNRIEVLQREERAREKRLADEQQMGLISVDEYRDGTGKDPLDLPGTRVLWLQAGRAPVGQPEDVTAILTQGTQQGPAGAPPPGGDQQTPPGQAPADQGAPPPDAGGPPPAAPPGPDQQPPPDAGGPAPTNATDALLAATQQKDFGGGADPFRRQRAAHAALIGKWEQALADELNALFHRQEQVVLARLTGAKARRHTRHWVTETGDNGRETKALNPKYIVDRARWIDEVVQAIADIIKSAFGQAGQWTAASLGEPGKFDPNGDKAAEVVAKTTRIIAEGFDARSGRLQELIQAADEQGNTIDEIAGKVKDAFQAADTWSQVTSRQVVGAMNAASLMGAADSGAVAKRWLATDDERTRPTHRAAEGQVQPLDTPFDVGDSELMFPGDPTGDPGEWINCRCTMLFQTQARDFNAELDADLADLAKFEAGLAKKQVAAVDDPFEVARHEWWATKGLTTNTTVRYYADKYGWGREWEPV